MPKSRRNKVVPLTQTAPKGKEHKAELINTVREASDEFAYLWLFRVEHMRNNTLKEVRTAWKGSRILMGRNGVMRKALGTTEEDECHPGARFIGTQLSGDAGLLFTNELPDVVTDWFSTFTRSDYARTGNVSPSTIVLPAGPIQIEDTVAPHSLEPQFRKLGMHTTLVKGVPTLDMPHTICKEGDKLNPNQVNLLKLFLKPLATFQVRPQRCLNLQSGTVVHGADDAEMAAVAEDDDDEE